MLPLWHAKVVVSLSSQQPFAAAPVVPLVSSTNNVFSLMEGRCRATNSCKSGMVVGVFPIAYNGLDTAARIHTAEENPGCLLNRFPTCSNPYVPSGLAPANVSHPRLPSMSFFFQNCRPKRQALHPCCLASPCVRHGLEPAENLSRPWSQFHRAYVRKK